MKKRSIVASLAASALVMPLGVPLSALSAQAAPDASSVVISEVYVRGGNNDGVYRDYVELYNPTDQAIDLSGMSMQYFAASGTNGNGTTRLEGSIQPQSYYLVLGASGTHTTELTVDVTGGMNMSGSAGAVILFNSTESQTLAATGDLTNNDLVIDSFGWGSSQNYEGAPLAETTRGTQAYHRDPVNVDTDNNSADFKVGEATPMYSGGSALPGAEDPGTDPGTDPGADPGTTPGSDQGTEPGTQPAETPETSITPIAEIQGTGAETPLNGQTVTTEGYVTAVYPTGGFDGFYMQTAGTGGTHDGDASHGIFVYARGKPALATLEKGSYVTVTGTAGEFNGLTQLSNPTWMVQEAPADAVAPVPVTFDVLPAGDAAREKYEGMLVQIEGEYTITNNYNTNRYGELGLAPGLNPLVQPSQVFNPAENPEEISALDQHNKDVLVNLDDGVSWDLTRFNLDNDLIPVPYLNVNDPARVGAQVDFLQPMIVDYRNDSWKFQPTEPINVPGADDPENYVDNTSDWVTFVNNERPAAPANLGSDVTLATFNVLNYFTTTADEVGCTATYDDRDGNAITASGCDPRGAANDENLKRQEQKIAAAINELDATVVGLEEIENSARFGKDRDQALNDLVSALNAAAGDDSKWAAVPSPQNVPANEDVIRLAFIYQPALVKPVGESKILIGNEHIAGTAREPLAQEFTRVDGDGQTFVAVVNHFKSKGSLSNDGDTDVYQGNNNRLRLEQAKATRAWVEAEYPDKPVFIIGDLNSYGAEDPIREFTNNGYSDTTAELDKYTYQFDGLVGSLDHILANEAAATLVTGIDIWDINADEPIAFEYSRYNYNVKYRDLYDTTAFRASDHDPIIVGLDLPATPEDVVIEAVDAPVYSVVLGGVVIPEVEGVEFFVDGEVVSGVVVVEPGGVTRVSARALDGFVIGDGVTVSWDVQPPRPEPEPEPEPEPDPGLVPGSGFEPEPKPGLEAGSEPGLEPGLDPELEPESGFVSDSVEPVDLKDSVGSVDREDSAQIVARGLPNTGASVLAVVVLASVVGAAGVALVRRSRQ